MQRSIFLLVAALAIVGSACTADPGDPSGLGNPGGEGIFAAGAGVTAFASCDDFLAHVKREAIERVGPYGLQGYGGVFPVDMVAVEESLSATTTREAGGEDSGDGFSTTNVQVVGIDEPDLVKTDGDRIFVVAQGIIHWIDASGDTPRIVATHELGGWGQQLFLSGDTLLVTTSGGGTIEPFADIAYPGHSERTVLTEIDVSEPGEMTVVRTLMLDGTVLSSRLIGDTARIVLRSGPVGFDWSYPEGSGIKAEREATERNKELIRRSTIENWVPWYVLEDRAAGTSSDGPLLSCDRVGYPDQFAGLTMLSVMTIDLSDGLAPNGVGLLADGETVYASAESLYVATSPWRWWPEARSGDGLTTHIHRFDISGEDQAAYVASGQVEGILHSQFALDEHEGILRVVVTDGADWRRGSEVPETSVVALDTVRDRLVEVGSVGGLGKNERVYSVRFIEDKAYVVTFRQVDPLYVVDMSDPTNPTVEGELKINGYSSYLHPIGEDILLGVGQDATEQGRVLGTQVSVFDVSDPENPIRMSRLTFEDAYSEAEWDHHAFLWWPADEIVILPIQRWSWDERNETEKHYAGAVVVKATSQRVEKLGEIEHPSQSDPECEECWTWTEPIMRSVIIGDSLFTISQTGVMVSDLDTLEQQEWLRF
jgi:hypothetical protein